MVTDPEGSVLAERYGPLLTQRGPHEHVASPLYKGADTGTNQTSELGALTELLLWLAEEADLPTGLPPTMLGEGGKPKVLIRPDSMYAMNLAQGYTGAKYNRAQVEALLDAVLQARERWSLFFLWTPGHKDVAGNIRADQLANLGVLGEYRALGRWSSHRRDGHTPTLPPPAESEAAHQKET